MRSLSLGYLCLLYSLIGCGSVTAPNVDPDATTVVAPDAAIIPTTMTVLNLQGASPAAGVHVLFFDLDNTLIADVTTDAEGKATALLPDGGTVVYIYNGLEVNESIAFATLNVVAGSELQFGGYQLSTVETTTSINYPSNPGATSHTVVFSCGKNSRNFIVPSPAVINTGCPVGQAVDILVDSQNGTGPTGTARLLNTPLAANMTVASNYLAPRDVIVNVSNVPAMVENVDLNLRTQTSLSSFNGPNDTAVITGTSAQGTMKIRNVPEAIVGIRTRLKGGMGGLLGSQTIYSNTPLVASVTIDASDLAPWVSNPQINVPERKLSWDEMGSGSADLSVAFLFIDRGEGTHAWVIGGDHQSDSLTLPVLPASYDNFNLVTADAASSFFSLQLLRSGALTNEIKLDVASLIATDPRPDAGERLVISSFD